MSAVVFQNSLVHIQSSIRFKKNIEWDLVQTRLMTARQVRPVLTSPPDVCQVVKLCLEGQTVAHRIEILIKCYNVAISFSV